MKKKWKNFRTRVIEWFKDVISLIKENKKIALTVIAFVVVIIVVIVVTSVLGGKSKEVTEVLTTEDSQAADYVIPDDNLEVDAYPEINDLMKRYYGAAATGDLLTTISETFVSSVHDGDGCEKNTDKVSTSCNATMSVLDLSKIPNFITAFNSATNNCKFNNIVNKMKLSLEFGIYYDYDYNKGNSNHMYISYNYGLVDLASLFNNLGIYTNSLKLAIDELVIANNYCGNMPEHPCGISVFVSSSHIKVDSFNYDISKLEVYETDYNNINSTRLNAWRDLMITNGSDNFYKD